MWVSTIVMRIATRLGLLLFAVGWLASAITPAVAAAQAPAEPEAVPQAATPAPSNHPPAAASPAKTASDRAAALAQVLDPEQYGPAFYSGAQAELIVPDAGVSALVFGYDAVWMQTDVSFGLGVGGDPEQAQDASDTYIAGLRLFFPVHRGIRADYGLGAGGGVTLIDPPEGSSIVLWALFAGARFRVYVTPSVAVGATLGMAAFLRGEHSSVLAGARPLGAASVVYFFR